MPGITRDAFGRFCKRKTVVPTGRVLPSILQQNQQEQYARAQSSLEQYQQEAVLAAQSLRIEKPPERKQRKSPDLNLSSRVASRVVFKNGRHARWGRK